jgi:hypothetical protein
MPKPIDFVLPGLLMLVCTSVYPAGEAELPQANRDSIARMKSTERGPFSRIRWFCNDGTELPPGNYACAQHSGGYQHGEWSETTLALREQGFYIANLLAGMDVKKFIQSSDFKPQLPQILIEKFLVGADDGWILRRAQFYRGAIQEEDERRFARELLLVMAADQEWATTRYVELRVAVRMLPHGLNTASIQQVRQVSASLSDRDGNFKHLRAKIHGAPGPEDAASVRYYAAGLADSSVRAPYLQLADEIDLIYQAAPLDQELDLLAAKYTAAPWLQELLSGKANELRNAASVAERFAVTAALLAALRDALPGIKSAWARLEILDLSLRTENENFRAAAELRQNLADSSRLQRVHYLAAAGEASYGSGVLNARLLAELQNALQKLSGDQVALDDYRESLNLLSRAPGWGTQSLRMYFFEAMEKLAEIEPLAMLFIQDQLRGSPLLFYSTVLDGLLRDANQLAGVTHQLFGQEVGVGFNALNPGLAQGTLHTRPDLDEIESFSADGIYLLPETVSDLPPVAGILTGGEGNPLSHVQLLARNLGIPNVTVDDSLIAALDKHNGEHVVMAVSQSGLVEISLWDEQWSEVFATGSTASGVVIEPDLEKLDLSVRELLPLDGLRSQDSGRVVGPKAAKLGELRAHYAAQVSRGIAIPFGLFYQEALMQPHPGGQGTVYDWMKANYQRLDGLPESDPQRAAETEAFRAELHGIIRNTQPSERFKQQLQQALQQAFDGQPPPGMFIRSDTNVEDLPGFTGAGLNLTLPNVMGSDNLLAGIAEVWASPFTARAFAWRQAHMTQPEHVYTSILLLESVANDKSGVLVTQDIDTGNRGLLSVAVNEGVGGAVDGQAAESLRIPLDGSRVQVLATATAPWRRMPNPAGGLYYLPSSGSDTVLQPGEIRQLMDFSIQLPSTFPPITDAEGKPAPADVEFGFINGELRLFQIRPFLDSKQARGISYLQQMESRLQGHGNHTVDMEEVPGS